jgi:hypothetical protein
MSVNLPIGSNRAATIRRYVVFIHCAVGISDPNSAAMFGNMTFDAPLSRADPMIDSAATEKASQGE